MGVFGELSVGNQTWYTVEEVWRNNAKGNSCIPIGEYRVKRGRFPKHGEAFEVLNVPNRTAILIHVANTVADIEGCIGPGKRLGALGGVWAVLDSGDAYREFMEAMHGVDEFDLKVFNDQSQGVVFPK